MPSPLRAEVSTRLQSTFAVVFAVALLIAPSLSASAQSGEEIMNSIGWTNSGEGKLGKVATLDIPAGCRFTDGKGAKKFLELTQNPYSGSEVGALTCETPVPGDPAAEPNMWFVIFEYDASGYVKDEEKDSLNADKILGTLREGQAQGNEERRRLGWEELILAGWARPPYYDQETNNLTWAVNVVGATENDTSVNHSVRMLGRGGVLKADLVSDPSGFAAAMPTFNEVIDATIFVPGQKYAEWQDGDKVAAYGLTALVAGGAGVAAAKLGLFGKLWKLLAGAAKLVIVGLVAVGAWLRKLFSGRSRDETPAPAAPARR
jgi:uncharacterized membrane-anchored protein